MKVKALFSSTATLVKKVSLPKFKTREEKQLRIL